MENLFLSVHMILFRFSTTGNNQLLPTLEIQGELEIKELHVGGQDFKWHLINESP